MALYFPLCLINYTGSSPWLCPPLLFPKGSVELVSRVTSHVGKIAYLMQSKIEFSLHMNFARYLVVLTDLSLFFISGTLTSWWQLYLLPWLSLLLLDWQQ